MWSVYWRQNSEKKASVVLVNELSRHSNCGQDRPDNSDNPDMLDLEDPPYMLDPRDSPDSLDPEDMRYPPYPPYMLDLTHIEYFVYIANLSE